MSTKKKPSPDSIVREIKRKTRRKYSAEEKVSRKNPIKMVHSLSSICKSLIRVGG
jgi:hypothetical protein